MELSIERIGIYIFISSTNNKNVKTFIQVIYKKKKKNRKSNEDK